MTEVQALFIESLQMIQSLTRALGSATDCLRDMASVKPSCSHADIREAIAQAEAAVNQEGDFLVRAIDALKQMGAEDKEPEKLWTVYLKESALGNPPQRKTYESYIEASARAHYEQLAEILSRDNWRGHIILTRPDGATEWSEYLPRIENVPCGGPKQ